MQAPTLYSGIVSILYRSDPAKYFTVILWDGVVTWQEWQEHIRRTISDRIGRPFHACCWT